MQSCAILGTKVSPYIILLNWVWSLEPGFQDSGAQSSVLGLAALSCWAKTSVFRVAVQSGTCPGFTPSRSKNSQVLGISNPKILSHILEP